jgi:SAM-dependent methyltransferase
MEIYKNLMYVPAAPKGEIGLAESLIYDNKIYYRYMDTIYIPNTPSELSIEDVAALSEIRIKLNGEVIDYSYTKELIFTLISKLNGLPIDNIIDFGCGGGILSEVLETASYRKKVKKVVSVDISNFAVTYATNKYKKLEGIEHDALVFDGTEPLAVPSNSIDAVFSSFVMHFTIYDNQLEEIYRALKSGGSFVYNDYVYNKYPSHTKKIIHRLKSIGFTVHEETINFQHPDTKDLKLHRIIKATKNR